MTTTNTAGIAIAAASALLAIAASAPGTDQDRKHNALVKKDLFAVITLQGHDCGKVVTFERQNKDDYVATCKNGKSFRIYVVPEGRVAVDKQQAVPKGH